MSPKCPLCGEEISDSPYLDFVYPGTIQIECAECGKEVLVDGAMTVEFTARKIPVERG